MGNGVFAVFGVPAAHEDDPERAVRAVSRHGVKVARVSAMNRVVRIWIHVPTTTEDIEQILDLGFWLDSGLADHRMVVHSVP